MDSHRRDLERKFQQENSFEAACNLLRLDFRLGIFRLEEQAQRFGLSHEDIWDCAKGYIPGYTQSLLDAFNEALRAQLIEFEEETTQFYTQRRGPNTLLSDVIDLATANHYFHSCKEVSIPGLHSHHRTGPAWAPSIFFEEEPLYHSHPMITFVNIPEITGGTNTATIYIRSPDEMGRAVEILRTISQLINRPEIRRSVRDRNLTGVNYYTLEQIEAILAQE